MGITLSTHYCMGRVVDTELMVGVHDLSCGMMDMEAACDYEGVRFMASGCCDNVNFSIEIEDDYQIFSEAFTFDNNFLVAFTYAFLIDYTHEVEQVYAHSEIYPPPLDQDYQSLYQSFLL
jgi:hypothetical protein